LEGSTPRETGLPGRVGELVRQAWRVREEARPREIRFDRLTATRPVSVTGAACGADCAHCGGHYLRAMLPPGEARRLAARTTASAALGGGPSPAVRSWLVSGGCRPDGSVPLLDHVSLLEELGRTGPLNLHTGIVRTEDEARALAAHAEAVSLDFTLDEEAVDEVYGFDGVRAADFVRSFQLLAGYTRVVPHVLIGLNGGQVKGEVRALAELARLGAEAVVLLVLIPTPGSRYEWLEPPPLVDVAGVLARARLLLPRASVALGCMRPKGSYRQALDILAVRAGVDRIAVPTPAAVEEARELGLETIWSDECCVFPSGPARSACANEPGEADPGEEPGCAGRGARRVQAGAGLAVEGG